MQSTMMDVPLSLNHLLERAGTLFANNKIVSRLPDKSLRTHSYGEYHQRTRRLAAALLKLGLKKGDRVATLAWNHHAHLECYFGIPAAGGVMHTLNLRLAPDEIGWIAADAEDRFLVVDDILLPLYRQFAAKHAFEKVIVFPFSGAPVDRSAGHLDYEALLAEADGAGFEYAAHDEDDPVAMCYTSGTTGRPKGVAYSHRSTVLHTLVGCLGDHWGLRSTDCLLPVTPMFHANSWGLPYGAVMLGIKIVLPGPHLHPDDLLDLMTVEPPTLALGVPTIWMGLIQTYDRSIADQPGRWKLPRGMRSLVGGAAVPEALIRAFAKHDIWIIQGWGMTETSPLATVSYPRPEVLALGDNERFRRAAMAGIPAPLVDLRIRGDDGADAPWDGKTVGEIQVKGAFITGSYHRVAPTEEKFTDDGWLRTGDVAAVDELGFVRITDRTKDLIKSGGEWISSVDLENALMAHPSIAEAAVIAIPDPKWSERPLACIVWKQGAEIPPPDALVGALGKHLLAHGFAKWQLPDRYEVIDGVPRTSTGKFWKLKLRERFPR
jgi:fatty-acyl-CoA synthase